MDVRTLSEDKKISEYLNKLNELRKDGEVKSLYTKQRLDALKDNKLLSKEEKNIERAVLLEDLENSKRIIEQNKDKVKELSSEALSYSKKISSSFLKEKNTYVSGAIKALKEEEKKKLAEIKAKANEWIASLSSKTSTTTKNSEDERIKSEINAVKYELKSEINDLKSSTKDKISKLKDENLAAYTEYVSINRSIRGGKTNLIENINLSFKSYIASFKPKAFLLNNGIYLAILVFFIVCVIIAPLKGMGQLFTLPNILTILEQSSTRMFYALGVAGLILLAGTDLSVGRMVALGSVTTGLILHPGKNIVSFINMGPWDFSPLPMFIRVLMALLLSVLFCAAFSAFSGVFTARLKMHPFISTLATQMIIYGILFFGTKGVPTGSIDDGIRNLIGGRWYLGSINGTSITFPKLIIPAIIAIIVAWFIWNKTSFGKNMYAVGGNAEAAAVSGISVFKTTMLIFIMAGIFYGCGAFLEAFRANASAGTGQGFELDAIAACVVGGISFSGGIGKIRGAVLGVIIFTSLTYCLTFLGIDTNLQFVFKGLIILAAVALDSLKYLNRK